jgi:hypothetical protein
MRKSMTVTPNGGAPQTTNYAWDDFAAIAEEANGAVKHYAVSGQTPLWETTGGASATYALDSAGSVTGLWGNAGLSAKFEYDVTVHAQRKPLRLRPGRDDTP